jgi:hypothetical protein
MGRLNKIWIGHFLITISLIGLSQSVLLPQAHSAAREVTITLSADDNISGVAMMQIAENKDNPPAAIAFSRTTVLMTEANILWVRVQDRALNWSQWVEVQVGGAPVIRDPLAKTVYIPVPLVPYVPSSSPSPTPTQTQNSGGGSAPSGGVPAISAPIAPAPPPPTTEIETSTAKIELTKSETLTAAIPTPSPSAEKSTAAPAPSTKSPLASPSTQATIEVKQKSPSPSPSPTPSGVKAIPAETKPALAVTVSTTSQSKVAIGANKVLEVKMPNVVGGTSVKSTVTDSSGKTLPLSATLDKKTGKITIPKLTFSKPGTYQITTVVGNKTSKVTVVVR